jgi:hypothetical protein
VNRAASAVDSSSHQFDLQAVAAAEECLPEDLKSRSQAGQFIADFRRSGTTREDTLVPNR